MTERDDHRLLDAPRRLGRYTLTHLIGKGGMAEVYLAQQDGPAGFAKTVVVKRIRRALLDEPQFVEMFVREARVAARLNHANVVQIFELCHEDDEYFIAMEYLDGITLHRAARRCWALERSMPMEVVLKAIGDAALGVHHAHSLRGPDGSSAPLIHRDISPDNLVLTRDGMTKVLDFGIAKDHAASELRTSTGEIKGKVPFMSPEQIRGEPLDGRSDVWSLGVTAFWLLTGRRPFEGASDLMTLDEVLRAEPPALRDLNPLVPRQVQRIVLRALEKDPAARLSSGAEMHAELSEILGPAAGQAGAAAFAEEMLALPSSEAETGPRPVSTVAAARPLTAWLQRLGEGSQMQLDDRIPRTPSSNPRTPSSGPLAMPAESALDDEVSTSTLDLFAALEEEPRRTFPRAGIVGALTALLLGSAAFFLLGEREPQHAGVALEPSTASASAAPPREPGAPSLVDEKRAEDKEPEKRPQEPPHDVVSGEAANTRADAVLAAPATAREDSKVPRQRAVTKSQRQAQPVSRTLTAKAPSSVQWRLSSGTVVGRGSGSLRVPKKTDHLIAIDSATGGRMRVPVSDAAVVDWGALPRGRVSFRVRPWAEVHLGSKRLGTTPLDPLELPAGRYPVTLKMGDVTVNRNVEVKANGHAILKVNMNEP